MTVVMVGFDRTCSLLPLVLWGEVTMRFWE
jgi:hypothetical protein